MPGGRPGSESASVAWAKISSGEPFAETAFSRSRRSSVTLDGDEPVLEHVHGDELDLRRRLGRDDPRRAAERDGDDVILALRHAEPGVRAVHGE